MDARAVYAKFNTFLDRNYAAGDAISGVQTSCPQLGMKLGPRDYPMANAKPISEHAQKAVKSVKALLESYAAVVGRKHEGLEAKINELGKAALDAARIHDSLLKIDRASASYCLPDIEALLISTGEAMCHPEEKEAFRVESIGSLEDAMRYMHESAIETIFEGMHSFHENATGKSSDAPIYEVTGTAMPFFFVADLGGGVSESASGRKTISKEEITSEPLKAVDGIYPKGGLSAFASRDFMNAQVNIGGFHHATVEAMMRKDEFEERVKNYADNNHIRVRYIERATREGMTRRVGHTIIPVGQTPHRLDYISAVMERTGFEVKRKPGRIDAKMKGRYPESTEKALKKLFRLFASCGIGMEQKMDLMADEVAKLKGIPAEQAAKEVVDAAVRAFESGTSDIYGLIDTVPNVK